MVKDTLKAEVEPNQQVMKRDEETPTSRALGSRTARRRVWTTILGDALLGSRTYVKNYTGGRGGE